ncbi:hypothetical protein SEPL_313 [Salmonella phage SE_PL]|uniref:hypothetical protein n=1 Tax=Salmonella enterica TaxID=28901 RepID=UPI000FDF8DB9|nr:hypothetical protein CPT_Munch_112 [Salmonella phage Munch]EAZ2022905.1 hypothetical protein [Salmonella enterica]ECV9084039.1 hypothetical protein [Salmonella enterica subsp. enterica serovar Infantis]MCP0435859.1 hypothetical protein [Salmonella enterica subsp. enterica serovar Mbandaka]QIG62926.1 hypothetical protein SEPL_313 [Salmonella phage SE_PL]WNV47219.1 hypothetical protein [Klebsiella phage fENko-Kae01]
MSIITIAVVVWLTGFIGGMGVLLYDYRDYGRTVYLPEFLKDTLLTFVLWPCIVHHIIWYSIRGFLRLIGVDIEKLKNIKITKGE